MALPQPPQSPPSYKEFELPPVSHLRSLFVKIFTAFFLFALVPALILSLLVIAGYQAALQEYVPVDEVVVFAENLRIQFLLISLFILIIVAFSAFALSRSITRPLQHIVFAIRRVSAGDLHVRVSVKRSDELGSLTHFFNVMVEELAEVRERNLSISRMKSQFISVAAHQLRTPLSAIKWTFRLLLDGDIGSLEDEQKKFLRRGYETNERMISLVNDLLDVSRIEEGKFGFNFREVDMRESIDHAIDDVVYLAEQRGVTVRRRFDVRGEESYLLTADPDRLHTVLVNLLDNAIRYSNERGEVVVGLICEGALLKVSIQDHGIGIPAEEAEKVFTRFFRASNAIRLQTDGSGLGLFIVRNIVKRHGGTVWFRSREGEGTTFFFTLPLAKEAIPEADIPFQEFVEGL